MKLSIIIINYNTTQLLKSCLESLFNNYKKEFNKGIYEVVVVDNASSDRSITKVRKWFPEVKLIFNKSNLGFAKANNLAIKKTTGEYILFLNPDTLVNPNTLNTCLEYLNNHEDVGIVGCKVILANGDLDHACHRGFPTPWRALTYFSGLSKLLPYSKFFNGYHLGYRDMDKIHQIDSVAGAFLMIPRIVGDKLNWFDEDYFWYGEDLDLCFRVKQAGYQVVYIPSVSIIHHKGAASGIKKHSQAVTTADLATRQLATQAHFSVMRIFYKKHYQNIYPRWLTNLVLTGIDLIEKFTSHK